MGIRAEVDHFSRLTFKLGCGIVHYPVNIKQRSEFSASELK
ncbi:unnamed protein product [Rhodiola kirilowii]